MKNVIKDLAAVNAVSWGTIAEKIDENFSELENSIPESGGSGSGGLNESQLGEYLTKNQYAKKSDIPSVPTKVSQLEDYKNYTTKTDIGNKQDKLVSGSNIKTVNGMSLLGGGDISIKGGGSDVLTSNLIPKPVSNTFYNGKKIACVGDSITQGVGASDNSKRYTTVLAGLLGATEVNLGQSGTVLCTGGNRGCNIGKLTVGNLNGCSVVTIMMGINDWDQAGEGYYELGEYGSTDTTTIYGAVDMWCKKIIEIKNTTGFEDTKFFFITPIITSWNHSVGGNDWNQEKTNIHGYKLRDLCQAIINVCADYKIPVLDMNKYSGIYYNSAEDNSVGTFFGDGIHPNTAGHEQIAKALKEYLLKNPTYVETDEALNFVLQSLLGESTKISYPNFDNVETFFVALESITLTPSAISLTEGEKTIVTAKLTPTNTTQISLKWESSNTSVATVADGVVTAMAEGSATITCKSVNNSSIYASVTVAVSKATSTDLTGLLISESTKTVTQGQTATLSVSYVPSATTQKGVTWSSDNTAVATVVGNGDSCTVTAVGGGQCNITATSTVNSSIKASCFFTTTEQSEGGDGGDASSYDLGSNVTLNADGTLVGKVGSGTYGQSTSRALYKVPLKAGMEVEVQHTFSSGYGNFVGWGVDNVSSLSELKTATGGQFPSGLFVVYYDSPANVNAVQTYPSQGNVGSKSMLVSTGNETSPRIAILKRDADGVLSGTYNGTAMSMPSSMTGLQTANASEDLYVWIGGIDSNSTWKINYFGELR